MTTYESRTLGLNASAFPGGRQRWRPLVLDEAALGRPLKLGEHGVDLGCAIAKSQLLFAKTTHDGDGLRTAGGKWTDTRRFLALASSCPCLCAHGAES